jgi:hypothetical protein
MQVELVIRGTPAELNRVIVFLGGDDPAVKQRLGPTPAPSHTAAPNPAAGDVEAIRLVRPRCGLTWDYVKKAAAAFEPGQALTLAEIASKTGTPMRKLHSVWNGLGKPLRSENVQPFFRWVPGTSPKRFTLSEPARSEILNG